MRFIVNRLLSPINAASILLSNGFLHIAGALFIDIIFCIYTPLKWWQKSLLIAFILLPLEGFISSLIAGNKEDDTPEIKQDVDKKEKLAKQLDAYTIKVINELDKHITQQQFEAIPKDANTVEAMRGVIGVHFFLLHEPSETAEELAYAIKDAYYGDGEYCERFIDLEDEAKRILKRVNEMTERKYGRKM